MAFDAYQDIKGTGSFIVIDKYTHATLGAGMIVKAGDSTGGVGRVYTEAEVALNHYIRTHFPEWGCRSIDDVVG